MQDFHLFLMQDIFCLGMVCNKSQHEGYDLRNINSSFAAYFTDSDTICKYNKNVSTVLCSPCFSRAYYGNWKHNKWRKYIRKIDVKQTYDKLESIRFNNIKFNYGRETVIEHGDAMLNKGDFVAIRGISGIGKSTLMKMLLGVLSHSRNNRYLSWKRKNNSGKPEYKMYVFICATEIIYLVEL